MKPKTPICLAIRTVLAAMVAKSMLMVALAITFAATGSALADEERFVTTWSQDFEGSDYADNWTAKVAIDSELNTLLKALKSTETDQLNNANNGTGLSQTSRTGASGETSYIRVNTNGRASNLGSGSAQYVFPSVFGSAALGDVNYRFEFDFFLVSGTGSSRSSYFAVRGENGIIAVIEIGQNTSTAKVYKLASGSLSQVGTYAINGRGTSSETGSNWYHAVIAADTETGLSLELTLEGAVSSALNVTLGAYDHLSKLYTYQTTDNTGYPVDWGFDNFALRTPASSEVPDQPEIGISEGTTADDDIKTVTISLADGTADGVSLYYRVGASGDYTLAGGTSQTLNISSTSTIYAYADNNGTSSEIASLYVVAGALAAPTAAITGVNGTSRTATFYSDYNLEYNTTAADGAYVDYSAPIIVNDSTTFYVRAKKTSTVDASVTFYSAVLTFAVTAGAGNTVKLAAPEIRVRGFDKIYLYADERGVEGAPQGSVIHYAVNGATQTDTVTLAGVANGDGLVPVATSSDGTVVTAWVTCDGYDNSDTTTFTYVKPNAAKYARRYEVDIVAYTSEHTNAGVVQDNNLKEVVEIGENTYTFFKLKFNGADDVISENLLPIWETGSNGSLRWQNGGVGGLYSYSTTKRIALKGLKAGDVVYVAGTNISLPVTDANLAASEDAHLLSVDNSGYERYYVVQSDGAASFQMARDGLLFAVRVYKPRKGFVLILQ